MRRLIPLLLPLAGLLYPFVLYFGMGKVSPPIFALALGAIWLIRAPSLLREPGGRWMIGVALTNRKLKQRGLRILEQATGATVSEAARALRQAGHDPCVALIMLKRNQSAVEARRRLRMAHGNMREALKQPN